MRVLWFTNTPSLGADHLNDKSVGGGWIGSLETELSKIPSIQLGISFNLDNDVKPFTIDKTKYYPVYNPSPKGKIKQLVSRWRKPLQSDTTIQQYLKIIDDFKPDVIHIFGTESIFGLIIPKTNVPCIIHLQGNLISVNQKWYSGLTAADVLKYSNKWQVLKGYGVYHNYFINKKTAERERKIFLHCKYFMGRTDWDRRITSVLSPNSKYFHCDEMLRPEFYSHQWIPQQNKNSFIIITTIRNNIYKGLETILECKRILNKVNSTCKIVWKIVGIKESDEIPFLVERKYKTTFKENEIYLSGLLQVKELLNEILKADVFLHPSHIDNSPNSVCEAMLLGMPVIATFAGGIPSITENKKEGLLVQDGDPYALAGAIIELIQNKNLAVMLGNNARSKAQARHNPKKVVNDLLNIYSTII